MLVLRTLESAPHSQPRLLTRRLGVLNVFWHAVEAAGARSGPRALEALVRDGLVRLHPAYPDHGSVTQAGKRALLLYSRAA